MARGPEPFPQMAQRVEEALTRITTKYQDDPEWQHREEDTISRDFILWITTSLAPTEASDVHQDDTLKMIALAQRILDLYRLDFPRGYCLDSHHKGA